MDKKRFRSAMRRAKLMQEAYSGDFRSDFYVGLQRGLRRLHHGVRFGDPGEYEKWLALSTDEYPSRQHQGIGYRIGLNYENLPDQNDIQSLRTILGWSTAHMAVFCGVSARTIEGWEQGRNVSDGPAAKIRELLDV